MGNKHGDIRFKWLDERGFNVKADKAQFAYMTDLWRPINEVQAVFCESGAGTGKTTLATLAAAYELEAESEKYDQIIYIRNAVAVRNQGFLPGNLGEKESPFMSPFIDALDKVQPATFEKWSKPSLGKPSKVRVLTSSYTRGVTWSKAFVIVDEAQNFTLDELSTVLTRPDDSCKVVVTGSTKQKDNKEIRLVGGLTPFEVMLKHFEGTGVAFHKLTTNYRGWFSLHADNVTDTLEKLRKESSR